jgi:cytochrome c oxidase subunit 3
MASVVELHPPYRQQEQTASLGMVVFLASWAMMFAGLFFAYGFIRSRAVAWPPAGVPALPVGLPTVNTVVLLCSSLTFAHGLRQLRKGQRGAYMRALGVTIGLGIVFLGLQLHVWREVHLSGLHYTSGLYGSVFYALTVFHALHVAAGLLVLVVVLARSLLGTYTEHNTATVRVCTMFWHFVDVVWVLMFLTIYVL